MKRPKRIKVYRWGHFIRDDGGRVTTYACRPKKRRARAVQMQVAGRSRLLSDPHSQEYQEFWFNQIYLNSVPMPQTRGVITFLCAE